MCAKHKLFHSGHSELRAFMRFHQNENRLGIPSNESWKTKPGTRMTGFQTLMSPMIFNKWQGGFRPPAGVIKNDPDWLIEPLIPYG